MISLVSLTKHKHEPVINHRPPASAPPPFTTSSSSSPGSSSDCPDLPFLCPRSSLRSDPLDPCPCRRNDDPIVAFNKDPKPVPGDVVFRVGSVEVNSVPANIASPSKPLKTILFGRFSESWRETIDFTQIGISIDTMRAIESFSRTGSVNSFSVDTLLLLPLGKPVLLQRPEMRVR
ncbi:ETO1-like protein 2 [Acorus gramineus]|uniref:ETO1-like protein 2 n=1 Tax=Acorus gramineus TaxID=55184 RepID=A0AAV9BPS3_ACOGR|nr:ETO1-like protein 2 [Acorus gramineus]